jgi:hypothetical protein
MLLALFSCVLLAQDLDVALRRGQSRGLTLLDQVEDSEERKAFQLLYREADPLARRTRVTEFLKKFPASWLLAQVYEAGARASFDLTDYPTGLYYARESLRLYPENPLLTGTLAAVLANRGETQAARLKAKETLAALDRFQPPEGMPEREWRQARQRLIEVSEKVLGTARQPLAQNPRDSRSAYAGSQSCQPCHRAQWDSWSATGMAKMLRKLQPDAVLGDFTKLASFGGQGNTLAKGLVENGNYFMDLQRPTGLWDRFRIDYTIGSKWQQAYATKAPNGELHVLPLQYNKLKGEWINYWQMIDPPDSTRTELGNFHRMRDVTSYQQNCAPCHTSQAEDKGFLEPGVNCEMCHGPSANHAKGSLAKWSFKKMDHRGYVEVCAQCHAQSAIREPQGFPPRYQRRPYVEFSRKAFYRDGRFRETTFIVESFERSACFQKGEAHCGHCHDPHPANAATNRTSLKHEPDSNQMCLQCHPAKYSTVAHTRHSGGDATRCVNCHMPKIMNSLLFAARNHQIDDQPRAEPTLRFGRQESPNACFTCHAERDGAWLQKNLKDWRSALPKG